MYCFEIYLRITSHFSQSLICFISNPFVYNLIKTTNTLEEKIISGSEKKYFRAVKKIFQSSKKIISKQQTLTSTFGFSGSVTGITGHDRMANQHRQKSNFLKKDTLPSTTKICVNRQINPSDCIAAVPDDQLSMKHRKSQ